MGCNKKRRDAKVRQSGAEEVFGCKKKRTLHERKTQPHTSSGTAGSERSAFRIAVEVQYEYDRGRGRLQEEEKDATRTYRIAVEV